MDFGVYVSDWRSFFKIKDQLLRSGFSASSEIYRLKLKTLSVDLIPFGSIESARGEVIWPGDGRVMNLTGFQDVYHTAHRLNVAGVEGKIRVATLAGLILLKIIAWLDRPHERIQDPFDIAIILRNYFDAGNIDRFYDEHSDLASIEPFTVERAGAALAARDLRRISKGESLNLSIQVFDYGWRFLAFRRSALPWHIEHQGSC